MREENIKVSGLIVLTPAIDVVQRERFSGLLEWLSQLGNAVGMEEWRKDSEAARILAGRLRNDQA